MADALFTIGADRWPGVSKLIEENGELGQVLGKILAFPDGEHPDQDVPMLTGGDPLPNLPTRLEYELGDMLGAIKYLIEANPDLNPDVIIQRSEFKLARFRRWHKEARAS